MLCRFSQSNVTLHWDGGPETKLMALMSMKIDIEALTQHIPVILVIFL